MLVESFRKRHFHQLKQARFASFKEQGGDYFTLAPPQIP
jgi:hypothetical protein